MRSVGLDLGVGHIAFCEVRDGKVVERVAVQRLEQLRSRLGPNTPPARVGFEASREGWHVHELLKSWGHEPTMVDTTRLKTIGIGQHGRKNDALDAEATARAVEAHRIPEAHVLSPARRELRKWLSVRTALVETRAQYVTTIRGLARAHGFLLPTCATENFVRRVADASLDEATRALLTPLIAVVGSIQAQLAAVEAQLGALAERDELVALCATVPGVGLMVAATFISVIDDAGRFKNAHAVGAYLGLVPSESTTGGPSKRRLGSITKQGNRRARTMLVQSAWHILRRKDPDNALFVWGSRIAKTRGKPIAAIALARKLAGVLWAMCRDGAAFDPRSLAERSAAGVRNRAVEAAAQATVLERAALKIRRRASRPAKTSEANMA
jgi:transposase